MNNIFQKNIEALSIKDKELAEKLTNHINDEIPQLVKENNFFNLKYKNTFLHNPINPLGEAQEIFGRTENSPVTIYLIYGIGLGYLFQISTIKAQGSVILYEPDLNILKIAFTLVDFSKNILQKNVFIADTIEKVTTYLHQKSNTKNIPIMLTTSTYRDLDPKKFEEIVEELQRAVGSFNLDLKYTQDRFYPLVKNIINNIPTLIKEIPLTEIKDIYINKTAVVVSAGPTLDRDIEYIKKYRENIILIVVGTALRTLYKHNITPDFLCIIEAYDSSKQIEDLDLSNVNFVTEPYSNSNVRKLKFKQIYSHISQNMPVNNLWKNLININTDEYISKGTVSYTALNVARILGCKRIVMVGQDLAYIEGQCYSKESAYKDLVCKYNNENQQWEITAKDMQSFAKALYNNENEAIRMKVANTRLKNLNSSLYYVKSIKGDKIPTESVYAAFIKPLTEFTSKFPDKEYINTSLVGAQIDGFTNISIEEALKDTSIIDNREINISYNIDINKLKEKLDKEIDHINCLLIDIENGLSALKSFNNNIKRYKQPTIEVLKDLKKVSTLFVNISTKNVDNLFDFITSKEHINLDYIMKISKVFDLNTINELYRNFQEYYDNAQKRLIYIKKLIITSKDKI